jgi:hypothetical protein
MAAIVATAARPARSAVFSLQEPTPIDPATSPRLTGDAPRTASFADVVAGQRWDASPST